MSKVVMLSIRPKWCEKIISGEKTVEVRKTRPKLETPFKCYIYCTSGRPDLNIPISPERLMQDYLDTGSMKSLNCPLGNGKVIGEFVCDWIFPINVFDNGGIQTWFFEHMERSCLTYEEIADYIGNGRTGYGWHISDLKIYDTPKKLSEFKGLCKVESDCCACPYYNYSKMDCDGRTIKRPPQSWCYVEATKDV